MIEMSFDEFHREYERFEDGEEFPYTCGSDYGGSVVGLTNYHSLKEEIDSEFPHTTAFIDLYGIFGGYGIGVIHNELTDEETIWYEDIKGQLENYPLIDDELMSQKEHEILIEHFRDEVSSELTKYVEKVYDVDIDEVLVDTAEEELYEFSRANGLAYTETGAIPFIDWSTLFRDWEHKNAPRTVGEFCIKEED